MVKLHHKDYLNRFGQMDAVGHFTNDAERLRHLAIRVVHAFSLGVCQPESRSKFKLNKCYMIELGQSKYCL